MIEIQNLGMTKEVDGKICLLMVGDYPPDCYAVFIKREDYPELKRLVDNNANL